MTDFGKIVVDTDVLIDFFRAHPLAVDFVKQQFKNIYISSVTITELYSGVRSENEADEIEDLLNFINVIDLNIAIARNAGLLRKEFTKSHGTGIIDSMIAATAIYRQMPVATLNRKHYPMIDNLIVPYKKY